VEIRFFKFLSDGTDQELADCLIHLLPDCGSLYRMSSDVMQGIVARRQANFAEVAVTGIEEGKVILFCKLSSRFYSMELGYWWKNCRDRQITLIRGPEFNTRPRYRKTYPVLASVKRVGT